MVKITPVITLPWKQTWAMPLNSPPAIVDAVTIPSTMVSLQTRGRQHVDGVNRQRAQPAEAQEVANAR